MPSGAALTNSGRTVTLTLPKVLSNTTDGPLAYTVTIVGRLLGATYAHGQAVTNTGRFSGGVPGNTFNVSKSYETTVVLPNPVIAKRNSAAAPVKPGAPVTFTLTVTNPAAGSPARPVSYDTVVVDCLPAGIDPASVEYVSPDSGDAVEAGAGSNGCPVGTTRLGWTVGDVPTGATRTLTYRAAIGVGEAGGSAYTNRATVTGSTLPDGGIDPTVEGVISSSATS